MLYSYAYDKENFLNALKKVRTYPEIKDDRLFSDIRHYENDSANGRLGLDKCLELCNGSCVEYGNTGAATCFPKSLLDQNSYYDSLRKMSTDFENNEITRTEKLNYVNMR